jgi:hypothetical protein
MRARSGRSRTGHGESPSDRREVIGLLLAFVMDTFRGRIDAAPASFAQVTNTENCCLPDKEVRESAPIRVTRVTTTISKGRWHADRLCEVVGGRSIDIMRRATA